MVQETTEQQYYYGTGKRKTAIARVRLYLDVARPGEPGPASLIRINGKPLEEALPWHHWQWMVQEPLRVTDSADRFTVIARVQGGGVSAQSQAIRHGIAKALAVYDETFKSPLRKHHLLTRDARIKESKKYGLKRAPPCSPVH